MGIEVEDLTTLDADLVEQNQQELATRLREENPTIDLKSGVLRDLQLNPSAILAAKNRTETDRLMRSMSLREIEADPTLADDDTVENVLSNYRVDRQDGDFAQGQITIVIDSTVTTTIGAGAIVEANGNQYTSNSAFVAKDAQENIQASTDRLIQTLADGNFAFVIDVTAVEEGPDSNVRKDTAFTLQEPPLNFVKAFATSDFIGGKSPETNQDLLTRLQEGLAAKAVSNRVNMNALLREGDDTGSHDAIDYVSSSIVGYGDPEMLRDAHTIFPMHFGGRADWYLRTQQKTLLTTLKVTATLIEKHLDNTGTWQFTLGRDTAAGVYEVTGIIPVGGIGDTSGGFEIVKDIRQIDLTGDIFTPDIVSVAEVAYSRFQTITIQFKDTETSIASLTAGSSTQEYDITLVSQPNIAEAQAFVGSRDHRNRAGDILIKAPVPCFLQLSLTVQQQVGSDEVIDTDAMKNALAETVNRIPFLGRLPSSMLCETAHDFLFDTQSISLVDMLGRVRRPDGTDKWLRSSEVLVVPDEPDKMVTAKTVQFFSDPDDISISLENVGEPPL